MVFQKRLTHLLVWVTCDSLLRKRMLLHSHTHQPIKCKHAFFKYPWVKLWNDTCLQKSPRGRGGFHFLAHGLWYENIWRLNLGGPTNEEEVKGNKRMMRERSPVFTTVIYILMGFYIKVASLSILLVSIICDKFYAKGANRKWSWLEFISF